MNIRKAQESDSVCWDDYVHVHPEATPYHLAAWGRAVRNTYDFGCCNLLAEDEGHIVGILPLVAMKSPLGRVDYISLPYCDVGGVLADNRETEAALVLVGLEAARKETAGRLELRGELAEDLLTTRGHVIQSSSNKVRMLLELPGSSEALWSNFKSKLRSQISKAEKNGLEFTCRSEWIDEVYSVFASNMRDLGSPVHARKWFMEIVSQFGGNATVGVVYHMHRAVGAGIILRAGRKVSIPWASTLRDYNRLGPNMLLYWGLLKQAVDSGAVLFDFGRSTPGEGTFRFKSQWGAIATPLTWHTIPVADKLLKPASGSIRIRELLAGTWRRLPLPLTRAIGPMIRKYISL